MSFGFGISFGRLCRRRRSLEEVYADARRIEGWERREYSGWIYEYNPRKRVVFISRSSMTIPTSS
jgi:hypothetical protein